MNMNLYQLVKLSEKDYDTYDTVYDVCVTVCFIEEQNDNDNYDKFCIELMKRVEVKGINDHNLIVDWSALINNNLSDFKKFSLENWREDCQYEDNEEEFVYQWIKEINHYLAGYVGENFYGKLIDFVTSLKYDCVSEE